MFVFVYLSLASFIIALSLNEAFAFPMAMTDDFDTRDVYLSESELHGHNHHNHSQSVKSSAYEYFETSYDNGNYAINGYAPTDYLPTGYPLHMWVTGTSMFSWDGDDQRYTSFMANRDFVSASISYANGVYPLSCSGFESKAQLLFDSTNPESALSKLCALPNVNCDRGVVVNGYSQGAQLVSLAQNYAEANMIRGVYEMGGGFKLYAGITVTFPCLEYANLNVHQSRIRSMVGEHDGYFGVNMAGVREEQETITGYNCGANAVTCMQTDGSHSGWYVIQPFQTASDLAPHCYAYSLADCHNDDQFDGNYDPASTEDWTFTQNMNWLAQRIYL